MLHQQLFRNTYCKSLPVCNITETILFVLGVSTSFIATGGTSYSWFGDLLALLLNTASTGNITAAGAYNVTVTDANGAPAVVQEHLL
jgi:hypothetical protein